MLIEDETPMDELIRPEMARGLVPRDLAVDPLSMFASPTEIPLIHRSEWDARIDEQVATRSSLEDLWMGAGNPVLNQNPQGYCWAYSTGAAIMARRIADNQPFVKLSPHAVACKIMGFQDKGGWCGLSAKFARENGYPSEEFWPQRSMSRSHDNEATWANARLHKVTEDFVDLTASHYYFQKLTFDQVVSCLLQNLPCCTDFDWWGHSVCSLRVVRIEAGSYGLRGPNSWDTTWGDRGWFTLRGERAIPNSALCIRATTASVK